MVDLTEEERQLLRDVLDIEIEAFDDVLKDTQASLPENWEELLENAGGTADIISRLRSIREKV